MTASPPPCRQLWSQFETVHDVIYFDEQARRAGDDLGLRGFWMAYFAFRLAPVGEVGAALGTALCFNFNHRRVARALPDAWQYTTAAQALDARRAAAGRALHRISGTDVSAAQWRAAADVLWAAAQAADIGGRALAAANQQLARPADDAEAVWQATTVLREHRGDGHNAVLLSRGLGPVAAHLLKTGSAESDGEVLKTGRGFTDAEWQDGVDEARDRGWLDDGHRLTAAGETEHRAVEEATDALAAQPWAAIGAAATAQALAALRPLAHAVHRAGIIPEPSPTGLAWDGGAGAPDGGPA